MAAGGVGQCGVFRAALYHVENIAQRHRIAGELVALANAREPGPFLVLADRRASGVQERPAPAFV